jgi:4'-phosphopantetheinyl transferase EntD
MLISLFPQCPDLAVRQISLAACRALPENPADAALIADVRWPELRRHEFLAGRAAAAAALGHFGVSAALPRLASGAAQWPKGYVGAIAHNPVHAVAAVAQQGRVRGVGVDIEARLPLPADAASVVLTAEERAWLTKTHSDDPERAATVIFSAKECVHKALHPATGIWLEFSDVTVHFHQQQFFVRANTLQAEQAMHGLKLEGQLCQASETIVCLLAAYQA